MLKINLTCVHYSDDVTLLGAIIDKNLIFKNVLIIQFARPGINFMLCGTLENFSLQKKLRYWVMLSQAFNSIMHLQYGCSVRKHFTLKLKKIRHKTLKVISNIGDSYNSLLLHSSYVSIHQRHFDFQRYSKAYLKSIQNLSGRSLSRKRKRDLF